MEKNHKNLGVAERHLWFKIKNKEPLTKEDMEKGAEIASAKGDSESRVLYAMLKREFENQKENSEPAE